MEIESVLKITIDIMKIYISKTFTKSVNTVTTGLKMMNQIFTL